MSEVQKKALLTWLKFALYSGAGLGVQTLINTVGDLHLSYLYGLLLGSLLKTAATLIATHQAVKKAGKQHVPNQD